MTDITAAYWISHPGRNPKHRFGEGRPRWEEKIPGPGGTVRKVTMLGPKIVNRWLPHTGAKERARFPALKDENR